MSVLFHQVILTWKKSFLVLQKFCDGFSGRVNHLPQNNIRQSKNSSLYPNAYFFAFEHVSWAKFNWISKENKNEKDPVKFVTSSLLPRSHFCSISSPESSLPLSSGTGNEGLWDKAISNHKILVLLVQLRKRSMLALPELKKHSLCNSTGTIYLATAVYWKMKQNATIKGLVRVHNSL